MAASTSVEYRCSDLRWCYLQQTVYFFPVRSERRHSQNIGLLDLQLYVKGLRSDKLSHKHDSNKHQSKAFLICDHRSDKTRSATHINKTYLVWLMYRLLFNQHYQHRTNEKLRSWANADFFFLWGLLRQAFPSLPSPSPVIPVFALFPAFSTNSRKRLLRRLVKNLCVFWYSGPVLFLTDLL